MGEEKNIAKTVYNTTLLVGLSVGYTIISNLLFGVLAEKCIETYCLSENKSCKRNKEVEKKEVEKKDDIQSNN